MTITHDALDLAIQGPSGSALGSKHGDLFPLLLNGQSNGQPWYPRHGTWDPQRQPTGSNI